MAEPPFGDTLAQPTGVAVSRAGDIFVSNEGNGTVVELRKDPGGGYGSPIRLPFGRMLQSASSVAVDASGDLFVADQDAGDVIELPAAGGGPWALPTRRPFGPLIRPTGVAVNAAGDVFALSGLDELVELHRTVGQDRHA